MKFNQIRVMMDYCSDPIWVANGDMAFCNVESDILKLPKDLFKALKCYQTT